MALARRRGRSSLAVIAIAAALALAGLLTSARALASAGAIASAGTLASASSGVRGRASESARLQTGYALEHHPALGIAFPLARSYEQIPVQPGERSMVLYYAEELAKDPGARRTVRPVMGVLSIDAPPPPPPPVSPSGDDPASEGDPPATRALDAVERWVEESMPTWRVERGPDRRPRDGYDVREYALVPRAAIEPRSAGWIQAYSNEQRTIAIVGIAATADVDEQTKLWRTSADKLRFTAPEAADDEELARSYARLGLSSPERRVAVRRKLTRGWKAEDTPNYVIVYDTADQPLIRKIAYDIEVLRGEYQKYFPPVGALDELATVRVCKDRDGYLAYGGMSDSAGYWNATTEELVLYDARKPLKNQPSDDSDTLRVVYHEAFHQYIAESTGEIAPHPWYNEGHGDFFAGADVHGKLRSIGVNPWRIELARGLAEGGRHVPWREIVRYELRPFMDDGYRCYAQSWSMIHFLRLAPEAQKREAWAAILPTYFETLKRAFAAELDALGERRADPLERWKAGFEARNRAVDAAFAGVDFEEIEAAWRAYVVRLEAPKR